MTFSVELTDYGQVMNAMLGVEERYARVDALVHLAAVPAPGRVPDHATFAHDMNATWNMISAAAAGSPTSSAASSETMCSVCRSTPRRRSPRSTRSPPRPESTYFTWSRVLEETMAASAISWDPKLKMIGLRFLAT